MASAALKIEPGTEIPGEGEGAEVVETQTRDFETEAREHGWRPKEDFKGDDAHWVDAEEFMKRADNMMPLLKATNARLKRELDAIKKDLKLATTHFEGAEKRAYDKALVDLEKQHTEAVEAGDVKAANAAAKEMRELKPIETNDWATGKTQDQIKQEATEALSEFRDDNSWYDRANLASASELDINARLFFDRMCDKNIAQTQEMPPAEFFAMIRDMTLEKFPQLNAKAAREKPTSAVSGTTGGRPRGASKSWDSLPENAKGQFQRFINRGLLGVKPTGDKDKDLAAAKAYYARTFDWEGYKE